MDYIPVFRGLFSGSSQEYSKLSVKRVMWTYFEVILNRRMPNGMYGSGGGA